jgi:hypothetical protein
MQTPKQLAQIAEEYDEDLWFTFLNQLDAVSRRRHENDHDDPALTNVDLDRMAP